MRGRSPVARDLRLTPSHVRLFSYGASSPLPVKGEFNAPISCSTGISTTARFIVVAGKSGCLLSKATSIILGLLHIESAEPVHHVHMDTSPSNYADEMKTKYPAVFNGFGKLKGYKVHVHIDPEVKPVAQPPRRIPFHLRHKVEEKLQELIDKDIIEPVSGPTSWASPLVVVPQPNGEVRVCIDMRRANAAVLRERHPIPTLEETLEALNGASMFSKLDLKWGYHQVEIDDDSRDITTFVTHKGVMRYKRLIFGLSSASEVYQYAIQQALTGLEGIRNISDDIIVFADNTREHDQRLARVLERLKDRNLTLNVEKCVFRAESLSFFGFTIGKNGIAPDAKKVEAIQNARKPTTPSEVRSFLGVVNYCGRFIQNLATTTEPLRELTRGDTPRSWGPRQEEAFNTLCAALTSDTVMAHFVTGVPTELRVDASPFGLGDILTETFEGVRVQLHTLAVR